MRHLSAFLLALGLSLALSGCALVGAVAHGVKSAQESEAAGTQDAAPAPAPMAQPAAPEPAPPVAARRDSVTVETLPPQ